MPNDNSAAEIIYLDTRGLHPPEPLIRILAVLDAFDQDCDGSVEARLDRRPVFLFPELETRKRPFTCEPSEDGGFLLTVGCRQPT
jgi:hypothetical protein